jgi:chemotaxis protein MotB
MGRRQEESPAGCPEWMVTYGDCMGLLLTFFIMLAAMSEVKEEKFHVVLESIREYLGYDLGSAVEPGDSASGSIYEMIRRVQNEFGSETPEGAPVPSTIGQNVLVQTVEEGYKITVGGKLLFDESSAVLKPSAYESLDRIARIVAGYYNKLEIRGHSAIEPVPGDASPAALFDLAYFRSKAVAEYLVNSGVDRKRIRLQSGGAFDRPASNLTVEGQAANRRVEIVVSDELVPPDGSGGA